MGVLQGRSGSRSGSGCRPKRGEAWKGSRLQGQGERAQGCWLAVHAQVTKRRPMGAVVVAVGCACARAGGLRGHVQVLLRRPQGGGAPALGRGREAWWRSGEKGGLGLLGSGCRGGGDPTWGVPWLRGCGGWWCTKGGIGSGAGGCRSARWMRVWAWRRRPKGIRGVRLAGACARSRRKAWGVVLLC